MLLVGCHPIVWKVQQFNLSWNGDVYAMFLVKISSLENVERHVSSPGKQQNIV